VSQTQEQGGFRGSGHPRGVDFFFAFLLSFCALKRLLQVRFELNAIVTRYDEEMGKRQAEYTEIESLYVSLPPTHVLGHLVCGCCCVCCLHSGA